MMLRLFMSILRPSIEQLGRKSAGRLLRIRICIYHFFLKMLMKAYSRYAVSDTVSLGNGRGVIRHDFRDMAFEDELARNRIDVRLHLHCRQMPVNISVKGCRCLYRYFKFRDILNICIGDKELYIRHDSDYVIEGPAGLVVEVSSPDDFIRTGVIELDLKSGRTSVVPGTLPAFEYGEGKGRRSQDDVQKENIFFRDHIPSYSATEGSIHVQKPEKFQVLEKRGFDIDTTF